MQIGNSRFELAACVSRNLTRGSKDAARELEGIEQGGVMTDKIVRTLASRGPTLDPKTAQAYTELLVQTIGFLDKQTERAEELLGADRVHLFLRAIGAHIETELNTRLKLPRGQS
jgi:hypothetical protein